MAKNYLLPQEVIAYLAENLRGAGFLLKHLNKRFQPETLLKKRGVSMDIMSVVWYVCAWTLSKLFFHLKIHSGQLGCRTAHRLAIFFSWNKILLVSWKSSFTLFQKIKLYFFPDFFFFFPENEILLFPWIFVTLSLNIKNYLEIFNQWLLFPLKVFSFWKSKLTFYFWIKDFFLLFFTIYLVIDVYFLFLNGILVLFRQKMKQICTYWTKTLASKKWAGHNNGEVNNCPVCCFSAPPEQWTISIDFKKLFLAAKKTL